MKTYLLSSNTMMLRVDVENGIIRWTLPLYSKFIGLPLRVLARYCALHNNEVDNKRGNYRVSLWEI